jgi:hypothetical protein
VLFATFRLPRVLRDGRYRYRTPCSTKYDRARPLKRRWRHAVASWAAARTGASDHIYALWPPNIFGSTSRNKRRGGRVHACGTPADVPLAGLTCLILADPSPARAPRRQTIWYPSCRATRHAAGRPPVVIAAAAYVRGWAGGQPTTAAATEDVHDPFPQKTRAACVRWPRAVDLQCRSK